MNTDFELTSVIERAKILLNTYERNSQFVFYAALELRYAIEIILYDWLQFVIQGSFSLSEYLKGDNIPEGSLDIPENKKMTAEQEKARNNYLAKDYKRDILKFVPEFEKKIEFMAILEPSFKEMKIPNLAYINRLYWEVGEYLHRYKKEIQVNKIHSHLSDILNYIEPLSEPKRCFIELNKEGEIQFDKFKNGQLSPDELEDIKRNGHRYHSGGLYSL